MPKDVMNAHEVAAYLGLAESTIYKKVEHREIPFTKVGSLLRFPKWIIDRWLGDRTTYPEDELYNQFVRLQKRYHLEQFLKAKGLEPDRMTDEQLVDELRQAIVELRSPDDA